MLDDPALDSVVQPDHQPDEWTVTVTVCGTSGSGRSVFDVVVVPPGFGLSCSASPSAIPAANTQTSDDHRDHRSPRKPTATAAPRLPCLRVEGHGR